MSELAKALLDFQKATSGFQADKKGNRSQYASIGAVINNVKQANPYGLTFTQEVDFEDDTMFVRTVMMHVSGEARMSRYPIFVDDKTNSQKIGGAITYAKRYALASMFGTEKGVEDSDDDGESNGLINDAPKTGSSQPDEQSSASVSLSDGSGHLAGDGLQPVASPLLPLIVAAPVERLKEMLEQADLKTLEAAFKQRGGMQQEEEAVALFGNRKRELVNG